MANKALLILESPWWDLNNSNGNQASVLPFFEGLARLDQDLQVYYTMFVDSKSFEGSLKHLLTAPQERLFLYVASHGYGGRIANSNFSNISKLLVDKLQRDGGKRVEGIIFGSCEIGGAQNDVHLYLLTDAAKVVWVFGYKTLINWTPSVLINMNLVSNLAQMDKDGLSTRDSIMEAATSALNLFNPDVMIGWNRRHDSENDPPDVAVKDAVRFIVRPRGRGNVSQDNTLALF
ncbi:hypothetical protein [Thiocapsa rosea]|uniref:Caspase domain-containing protein n=1 Tax=Thiocapsa rosea TaxID=69360 RepID=A0A495V5W2_9GAMM|nr:hypothetical protein [Thiocapsa rosea]RKT43985.1 hypothetical protein BDD21_1354 [Thiocapsa rosea]